MTNSTFINSFDKTQFLFQNLCDELGLQSALEKDCSPSTQMICLRILVDTVRMVFEVPQDRLVELHEESSKWSTFADFSKSQLQALLGKGFFVYSCVRSGSVFLSRLLNRLRRLPSTRSRLFISRERCSPTLIGSWPVLIQLRLCDLKEALFTCDASLHRGGATCFNECISFAFPRHIEGLASHITALELFPLVIAVKIWALSWPAYSFKFRVMTTRWYRLRIQVAHRILSCSVVYDNSG